MISDVAQKMMRLLLLLGVLLLPLFGNTGFAQQETVRARIDSLRWGVDFKSAEGYRRANQAKHLDSTYYMGHLIEAYHWYDKAEEHTGLQKAVIPMRRALRLFEHDYRQVFNRRYTRMEIYGGAWPLFLRQLDYLEISSRLINCYNSLEQPDSAYAAIQRLRRARLPIDFQSYQSLAWLYFRSRIFTDRQYYFLNASIEDNLSAALGFADSLEAFHRRQMPYIRENILSLFAPGSAPYESFSDYFINGPRGSIANTKGILYGYNFQPKLAANYFNQMRGETNLAKTVNLGYTWHSAIDFRKAEQYFSKTPDRGARSRGGHWQGYSTLFVYKGQSLEGARQLKEARDRHGFTIGYGWDNLCLARMFLYGGYVADCQASLDRADSFTEVHYNTSFREDQYRFMLKVLRLVQAESEMQSFKFEHNNRWLAFDWWKSFPELMYRKYRAVYQLADELAQNPERETVFYHIFHTENIISFDELWFILKNYDNTFFRRKFQEFIRSDPRPDMQRYYQYFLGRLMMEDGEAEAAYDQLTGILQNNDIDREYEKLLLARIHEACALIADGEGWEPQRIFHTTQLYGIYPQLMPFSDVEMAFHVQLDPALETDERPQVRAALARLRDYHIDLSPRGDAPFPRLVLTRMGEEGVAYSVELNREVLASGVVDINKPRGDRALAYALFRVLR